MGQRRPNYFGSGARRAEKFMVPWEPVVKEKVYQRDGWKCVYCGQKLSHRYSCKNGIYILVATVDHVVPISLGGAHMYSNLVTSCENCNSDKGSYPDKVDISLLLRIA